jgi:hypothetical protein
MLGGLVACATKSSLHSFGTRDPLGVYPPCPGSDIKNWHDCYGVHVIDAGRPGSIRVYGVHKNGRNFDRIVQLMDGEECRSNLTNANLNAPLETLKTCFRNGSLVSREVIVNGERSLERERELFNQEMSNECLSLGFKENSPELGNCILRLRELQRNSQTPQVAQPSQNKPSAADQLEGWAQILRGMQGAGQAVRPNPSTNLPTTGVLCLKSSEFVSGVYKTCVYKCVGGETTQTVSAGQACPPNARF